MHVRSLLENTELVLLVSIVLPLLFAFKVAAITSWITVVLGIVMFLSIRPFFKEQLNIRKEWKGISVSLLLNYVLLSGAYLLAAWLVFGTSSEYFTGYILLAIVPPAISIIPLCFLTKCDIKIADSAIFLGYALALIIIPLTSYLVFGKDFDMLLLLKTLFIVIVLPVLLAYLTRKSTNRIFDYSKIFTNILIGFILLVSISMNRSLLLDYNLDLLKILLVNLAIIFILGIAVYLVARKIVGEMDSVGYSLYATQKNEATGIAMALVMFTSYAAIPLIVSVVLQFVYFIVFEKFIVRKAADPSAIASS